MTTTATGFRRRREARGAREEKWGSPTYMGENPEWSDGSGSSKWSSSKPAARYDQHALKQLLVRACCTSTVDLPIGIGEAGAFEFRMTMAEGALEALGEKKPRVVGLLWKADLLEK